ncbi:TPA: CHAP domain-containing protein [Streptococcus agalactiae]|nr:CHAP domain-containing protein [Streptococcus agalactiae]HEO4177353.1 CHAP domain-containing protein [Streptococcus agalactiae]
MLKGALKKIAKLKIALIIGTVITSVFLFLLGFIFIVATLAASSSSEACDINSNSETEIVSAKPNGNSSTSSSFASIDDFVKKHEEAYLKSWKVGGFLPTASIVQTMQEVSFNPSVPSFGKAHNMGGVKWTSKQHYRKTIELFGEDAVSQHGSGTDVADNTSGSYAWFKSYDAGIVGKAEFMAAQTLYTKAINNTDGLAALNAIADGGWATDPSYKAALNRLYNSIGKKYEYLDKKAIELYGNKPVKIGKESKSDEESDKKTDEASNDEGTSSECGISNSDDTSSSDGATDGTGEVPSNATAWGWKPDSLPENLKKYIIDPQKQGLQYRGPKGWVEHSGQCVDLTESLGNAIWGHQGITQADGKDQARAWARGFFRNSVKHKPKKGAIFSQETSNIYGHTGIVCHVFKDGTILIVEQNTPLSGRDFFHVDDTWNYRILNVSQQKATNMTFAYDDHKKPNIK